MEDQKMQLRTCAHCKKLFNVIFNETLCPNCKQELEEIYKEVKEYVRSNPGVSILQVVNEFDNPFINERQLREWIKEDRLQFMSEYTGIFCRVCHCSIESGTVCSDCKAKMSNLFNSVLTKETKPEPTMKMDKERPKMRFLNK